MAQIEREPESPGAEFRIAIAGPVVSLTLAALFGGLWLLERETVWLAAPSMWLARINLMLALFNMIPGFPLDGAESSALSSGDPAMILDRQPATPPALSSLQPKFFVMKIPRPLWRVTAVNKVMVPWEKLAVVHSQSSLAQAVQGCTDHG